MMQALSVAMDAGGMCDSVVTQVEKTLRISCRLKTEHSLKAAAFILEAISKPWAKVNTNCRHRSCVLELK